ncbi:MAG: M20/M25/M40 family metallo-hydrolase [Acidobacteria bacterium]|nr:M20/M25/M40 family metallo-hydrolase [Acidobacteriota bacterium]
MFENIRESLKNPDFLRKLESDPALKAVTRNTISITILEGSNKINIIPPVASAEIDTRLVPGEKLGDWINELKNVIRDEGIKIETILAFEANASPVETDLVAAVKRISNKRYPGAVITYPVLAGFTDSHYFRKLGVNCYGFSPFVAGQRDLGGGFHGNDEKIGKQPYMDGVRYFFEIVDNMVR